MIAPDTADDADFSARMTAFADHIVVRVMCTHAGKGFEGGPIVIVAYLDDGSAVPHYRYWREEISEVGGRVSVVAQARGASAKTERPGVPRVRQYLECPCGTGFPFASDDIRALVHDATNAKQHIIELSAMPALINRLHKQGATI